MNHASQNTIAQNIELIRTRITNAEKLYARAPGSVKLLAVSKTRPIQDIQSALMAKQLDFGENYLQDALSKIESISNNQLQWHFIGPIQSNKTQLISQHFNWVHSVDRLKIAQRLSLQRDPALSTLNICIQVNSSNEKSKSGVSIDEAVSLAKEISLLPSLKLRGLMTIPTSSDDPLQQRAPFRLLSELKQDIQSHGIELDTLSMGMTNDMEAAIAEGATIVRIGTAIFGERN